MVTRSGRGSRPVDLLAVTMRSQLRPSPAEVSRQRPTGRQPPTQVDTILALQRSAGNAAIARRFAGQRALQRSWINLRNQGIWQWDAAIEHRSWYRRQSANGWQY